MIKYTISTIERKHIDSINKDVANCKIADEQGNEYPKQVSIWSDFPNFATLDVGTEVEGEVKENTKGYASLYAPKVEGTKGGAGIARSMELKNTNIALAQQRKDASIHSAQERSAWMWAKTNAATLIESSPVPFESDENLLKRLHELSTQIYNMEPLTPFNG